MWCACGQSERTTSCKGKVRSPVGGAIYANVIWSGMKWKYAAGSPTLATRPHFKPWGYNDD